MSTSRSSDEDASALARAEAHDRAGREREAIAAYREALSGDLNDCQYASALHGLGSTYRAIGAYEDAEATLRDGMQRFPNDPTFAPFLAMTLYNKGHGREAVSLLLELLLDTTNDERLLAFERAIRTYARDLDRTW